MLDNDHIEVLFEYFIKTYTGHTTNFFRKISKEVYRGIYLENSMDIRLKRKTYNTLEFILCSNGKIYTFDEVCRILKITNEDIERLIICEI